MKVLLVESLFADHDLARANICFCNQANFPASDIAFNACTRTCDAAYLLTSHNDFPFSHQTNLDKDVHPISRLFCKWLSLREFIRAVIGSPARADSNPCANTPTLIFFAKPIV